MKKQSNTTKTRGSSTKVVPKKPTTGDTKPAKPSPKTAAKTQPGTKQKSARQPKPQVRETSKLAAVVGLLRRKEGATIEELVKATGWQSHSVRGALSGAIKKKLGLKVTSAKADGVRTYRIVD